MRYWPWYRITVYMLDLFGAQQQQEYNAVLAMLQAEARLQRLLGMDRELI
ncbi:MULTISPECIES: hypothetical protein [Citrobacter]|nr:MULTISPECIES: hypothetical protein [Citrobacter]